MASFREREALARKQKEDARRFLELTHSGPRDATKPPANSALAKDSRDNTFRILQQQQQQQQPAVAAAAAAVPKSAAPITAPPPKGWQAVQVKGENDNDNDSTFLRHGATGCAIRGCRPPPIVGNGLACWRDLPLGWKLVKHDDDSALSSSTMPKFFFWNPASGETCFTFPVVEVEVEEEADVAAPPQQQETTTKEEEETKIVMVVSSSSATSSATTLQQKRPKLACFD